MVENKVMDLLKKWEEKRKTIYEKLSQTENSSMEIMYLAYGAEMTSCISDLCKVVNISPDDLRASGVG